MGVGRERERERSREIVFRYLYLNIRLIFFNRNSSRNIYEIHLRDFPSVNSIDNLSFDITLRKKSLISNFKFE